jgi:hypothetical protein
VRVFKRLTFAYKLIRSRWSISRRLPAPKALEPGSGMPEKRLLLVEDEEAIRELLAHVLIGEGYSVDAVGTSTGRPTAREVTEYLLLSKRTRQVFDTDACVALNPSKGPLIGTS